MIYFSDAPVRLDSVDEAQYQLLREFRAKYQTLGIIESFESTSEFREKFSRQLAQLVIARFAPGSKTEAIAFALQERQRSQDPIAASLSPKARELLIASTDGDGVVMRLHTMEGLGIQERSVYFADASGAGPPICRRAEAINFAAFSQDADEAKVPPSVFTQTGATARCGSPKPGWHSKD